MCTSNAFIKIRKDILLGRQTANKTETQPLYLCPSRLESLMWLLQACSQAGLTSVPLSQPLLIDFLMRRRKLDDSPAQGRPSGGGAPGPRNKHDSQQSPRGQHRLEETDTGFNGILWLQLRR